MTRKKGSDSEKAVKLLENVGANVQLFAGSGTPYSREVIGGRGDLIGSINGSNLPWAFRINLRVDKNMQLTWGGKDGNEKKHASLNIYLTVLNVLNTKNINNVYPATGNPNDDGYLNSAQGRLEAASKTPSPTSFVDLRNTYLGSNQYNYSLPRQARIGLILGF